MVGTSTTKHRQNLSKAANKTYLNGPKGLPATAYVHGFGVRARLANGYYQEKHRIVNDQQSTFFQKVDGGAFIYRLGIRWCFGPLLEGEEVIWGSIDRALRRLPSGDHEIIGLLGSGKPEITITRAAVTIVSGSGLKSTDLNGFSDPYVMCSVSGKPHLNFRTATLETCLNPIWKETFEIHGVELGDTLRFRTMDWDDDGSEDELIGVAKYQLVPGGFKGELPITLHNRKAGALRVEVTLPSVPKGASETPGIGWLKENKYDIRDPRKLVNALSHGGDEADRAVGALQALVAVNDRELRSSYVALGGIQALVPLLSEGSAERKLRAAIVLSHLGKDSVAKSVIVGARGIQPLLKLVFDSPLRVKEEAMGTILMLVSFDKVRTELLECGAVPKLVELLSCGSTAGASRAAQLLASLSIVPDITRYIIEEQAVPPLIRLLACADKGEVNAQAAFALASIANTDEHREVIIEANGLPPLVSLLSNGKREAPAQAAAAIAALTTVDAQTHGERQFGPDFLVKAGVIPPLLGLLSSYHLRASEQAAEALCIIGCTADTSSAILQAGALPAILALLKSKPTPEALKRRTWVAKVLHTVATFNQDLVDEALPRGQDKKLVQNVLVQNLALEQLRCEPGQLSRPSSAGSLAASTSFASTRPGSAKSLATTLSLARSSSTGDLVPSRGVRSTLGAKHGCLGSKTLNLGDLAADSLNNQERPWQALDLGVDLRFVPGSHANMKRLIESQ